MYRFAVKQIVRRNFARLSAGDADPVVSKFGADSRLQMMGDHALGGERRGREEVAEWFRDSFRRFPGLALTPRDIVVGGWPWDTRVAVRFDVRAPALDGGPDYANAGMQFLRLRWGRVVEDRLYEDTARLAAELERREAQPAAL